MGRNRFVGRRAGWVFALCAAMPVVIAAQGPNPAGGTLYVSGRERWVFPGQRDSTAAWQSGDGMPIPLDSLRTSGREGATVFISRARRVGMFIQTSVWRGASGSIDSVVRSTDSIPRFRPIPRSVSQSPGFNERFDFEPVERSLKVFPAYLGAADSRGSRTPVHLHVRTPRDTRAIDGELHSRVIGDTIVAGRPLRIVRDSGRVTMRRESAVFERTLRADVQDSRQLHGVLITRRLVDDARGLTMHLDDTLHLSGTVTQRYPDGRRFSSPVRFDRTQTVDLLDSAGLRAHREARARATGAPVGMVSQLPIGVTPIDPFNPRVQDSLVRRHATARTQTVRDTIDGFAYYPGIRERLVRNYVALGDTSRAILLYEREVTNVVTAGMYQLLRPVLNDPGKALRLGVSTTELFENFEYVTRYGPRGNGSDLLKWCEPAACELIARDWTAAREPRLRQVGLLALFSRDPAVWSDTVIRIAAAGAHQLDDISRLARGVRFTRADEPELTLPSSSAAWDSWLDWMNGGNAMALARRDSAEIAAVGRRLLGSTASLLRNGSPNDLARFITIAEARHHVSYRDSIAVHFANATSDTARFVFGTLLHALNAPVRTTDALLMALQAPSALDRQLASAEIPRLTYAPADSVTSRAIEQTLLGALIDGTALWSRLDTPRAPGFGPRAITSRDSTFLFADSLTNASAAQLRAADITRYQSPWRFPAQASGREIRISAVNRAGPFARINVQYSDLVRLSDGRGGGFASGSTYYLVLIDGVWRLVSESSWVT